MYRAWIEVRWALRFTFFVLCLFSVYVHRGEPAVATFFVALTALFAWGAVRALRERPRVGSGRRWLRGGLTAVAMLVLLFFAVLPVGGAIWLAQEPGDAIDPPALGLAHTNVTLVTSDGVRLAGWYVPARNRAAVVLVHGAGGSREGVVRHARLLASHGYGVLLYDARGRGESGGSPHGQGWTWQPDLRTAMDYLAARPDVDPRRIGALGLSTGAEVVLEGAARDRRITAVVADGAIARNMGEIRQLDGFERVLAEPFYGLEFGALRVLTWSTPSPHLQDLVPTIAPRPVLLVATGRDIEQTMNRAYHAAAPATTLWELPDVGHTHGLQAHPAEYERRVVGFFDRHLLRAGS